MSLRSRARRLRDLLQPAAGARPSAPTKSGGELLFWRNELLRYRQWMDGAVPILYGTPSPTPYEIVPAPSREASAALTWIRKDGDKYLRHLRCDPSVFAGSTLLDVGCGAIPYALAFAECRVIGIDPLVKAYRRAGYPFDLYDPRMRYLCAYSELIPLRSSSVDVVVSVNAIDHVDDFFRAAAEIDRVLRPAGKLRIEVHYHEPAPQEPWELSDAVVVEAFRNRKMTKVSETPFGEFYPEFPEGVDQLLVVWSSGED